VAERAGLTDVAAGDRGLGRDRSMYRRSSNRRTIYSLALLLVSRRLLVVLAPVKVVRGRKFV